jgi:putative phosphoesterase
VRVAALYDVHGNLPALEAVLAEAAAEGVDRIVCGGDVAAGPFPQECVELLVARGAEFVRGNADREPSDWVAGRLSDLARDFLAALPTTLSLDGVLYCHGSPRSDDEILTRISPEERVRAALAGVEERLVVVGHVHVQYDRVVERTRLVNAGSVGIPYEGRPGAFWALVDGGEPQLRRTVYPVDAAVAAIRASGYPDAAELTGWLLEPPDPDEVSAHFESIA